MKIAVAGGTGVVGRHVVREAEQRGHEVVVLSRSAGADVLGGEGLRERLEGCEAVVDVLNVATQKRAEAEAFFRTTTTHLTEAEREVGCAHHVVLSIVGIDRVPTGYYRGKLLQETTATAGPVPSTILRAAQFHEFAEQALGFVRLGPVSVVPAMRTQPIAAREVAAALVELAEQGPSGRAPDLAGPEVHRLADLARQVNDHKHLGRRVVEARLPGAAGRAMRSGALTTGGPGRGRQTFAAWLAAEPA
ncbi:SDR family oxidoreductase [Nocardioides marinquilinus]